jgi:hypothetical protein
LHYDERNGEDDFIVNRSMRPSLLILIALVTFPASCCKVGCISEAMQLQFPGYDWRELDSTLIRKYEPNTNFGVLLDSMYRNSSVTGGDGTIYLDDARDGLELSKDYQVIVRMSNKTYSISEISTKNFSCACELKHGKVIDSYVLDGVRYFRSDIQLPK